MAPRIARQAKLRERFAVREMLKRNWIHRRRTPEDLEGQVLPFFGISSIDETPRLAHAAKRFGATAGAESSAFRGQRWIPAELPQAASGDYASLMEASRFVTSVSLSGGIEAGPPAGYSFGSPTECARMIPRDHMALLQAVELDANALLSSSSSGRIGP